MSGYYDSGYQGGEQTCGVCGRRTDEYGSCRCIAERRPSFEEYVRAEDADTKNGDE